MIKTVLDDLCEKMSLRSWTVHKNKNGTVCTLRFHDADKMEYNQTYDVDDTERVTFKRKPQNQMDRDSLRMRMQQYRYQPRESLSESIEIPRNQDYSETTPVPGLDISPVSQLNASVFHMNSDCVHSSQTPTLVHHSDGDATDPCTPEKHIPRSVEQCSPEIVIHRAVIEVTA